MSEKLLNIKTGDDNSGNSSVQSRTTAWVMGSQKMRERCIVCGDDFVDIEKDVEDTNDTVKNCSRIESEAEKCLEAILSKYEKIVIVHIIKNEMHS